MRYMPRRNSFLIAASLISLALQPLSVHAQGRAADQAEPALVLGEKHTITSEILGEAWPYEVYFPASYDDSTYTPQRYPVLYVLSQDFPLATVLARSMSTVGSQIPELIVVGIPMRGGVSYHGHLTPTYSVKFVDGRELPEVLGSSGGGDSFLAFLREELVPQIDSTYRTLPYRVLAGHSIAGLFTLHAYLTEPDPFQGYLAIDPSLWWDNQVLVRRLEDAVEQERASDGEVYIALAPRPGEDQPRETMDGPIRAFAQLLEADDSPDLRPRFQEFPNEHHLSIPPLAYYHGLQHIFHGYEAPPGQFEARPETIVPHFRALSERLGVEIRPPESLADRIGRWLLADAFAGSAPDLSKVGQAVELFELNATLYPESSRAHESLARAYEVQGDTAAAIRRYEQALELRPESENVRERLRELRSEKPEALSPQISAREREECKMDFGAPS